MKVQSFLETKATEDYPGILRRVVVGPEDGAPRFIMRVFEASPGSSSPFHTHDWEHEVFILSGEGVAKGDGYQKPIGEGTVLYIAPNEKHCLTNTGKDVLRFVCLIPRMDEGTQSMTGRKER